jgi:hypothetical protein
MAGSRHNRRLLSLILAIGLLGPACREREEEKTMAHETDTQGGARIDPRIEAYLNVETKYHIAPPPSGLPRPTVQAALEARVQPAAAPDVLRQLVALALFYDARAAAPAFAALVSGAEESPLDLQRAATALVALGWLAREGEGRQRAEAAFRGLLEGARTPEPREVLLPACDALSPGPALPAFQRWLATRIAALDDAIAAAKKQGKELPDEQLLRDACQEFLAGPVERLATAAARRQEVNGLPSDAERIASLAALYLGDIRELNRWAGYRLIQIATANADLGRQAAGAFLTLAESLPAPAGEDAAAAPADTDADPEPDEAAEDRREAALRRARCLRAAQFFGASLGKEQAEWLKAEEDAGTDLLALRPDWKY